MANSTKRQRRLSDACAFDGFRPQPTMRGIFGDPKARVITLLRRSKKQSAAAVDEHRWAGATGARGGFAICPLVVAAVLKLITFPTMRRSRLDQHISTLMAASLGQTVRSSCSDFNRHWWSIQGWRQQSCSEGIGMRTFSAIFGSWAVEAGESNFVFRINRSCN